MPPKRKAASTKTQQSTTTTDFTKLSAAKLKEECTVRNLDIGGKKADLLKRLHDYENQEEVPRKKIKEEPPEEQSDENLSMKEKLKKIAAEEKRNKKKTFQVDSLCSLYNSGGKIYEDYDCMLNQTNIGNNNNKYYVIQLIEKNGSYYFWTRWGRVGEPGQNSLKGPSKNLEATIKDFEKKFKDKTKNNWKDRADFKSCAGKYTLIEMDAQDDDENAQMEEKLSMLDAVDGSPVKTKKNVKDCTLDKPTQSLIQQIFNNNMFKEAMVKMDLDVKKMPLGKLSKGQIAKGFEVLEELEQAVKSNKMKDMQDLTSRFYTVIPHNFGRQRPPTISNLEVLQKKMDMLAVLGDIEIAQSLQKVKVKQEEVDLEDHPLDANYKLLNCGLKHVNAKSDVYKVITKYIQNTKYSPSLKLLDVWEVDRHDEDKRFSTHDSITHRKLLWHGTNVAVVVAILKSGLRIMPHSGGRVGRGIYFASEQAKSHDYVGTANDGTGIMFLNEVALGTPKIIRQDDHTLKAAPKGFDSVLAQGMQEPDPKLDTKIKIGKHEIVVPQGKPIKTKEATNSSFYNSEYLVYKESQCRIRYLLKFKFY